MITLDNVRKVFNQGRPNEQVAVRDASLAVEDGKVTVLKGPSGSGKTTLLSVIGCMARPTAGRIWLGDREITSLPERFLTGIRRQTFGFIFQQFNLIRGISAIENVMLPAYPNGEKYGLLRERAGGLLELFNLSAKSAAKVQFLSGGEAQRVAIARALINNPPVIVADEPTAHLDTKLSQEFMEIMDRLHREGRTIIIASHDPVVYASPLVDRTVEMRDGEIIS
ncbi:MAG: ABC transporter ATP-binding protein [Nitrospirae bacterium]|nr:ABC transporter ATP-binding protein [Nitrospirota bacterium]